MSYLVSQLWLCLLLALLFGALVGWFLRGGCKAKLVKISDDWKQRYTLLEDEKNSFVAKSQDEKKLNDERKSLLSRLTAMENGANIASNVLKENKEKLDETENRLAEIKLELQQREAEISELKKNKNTAMEKSSNDEEKSLAIQGLLDTQISESEALKRQFEQDLSAKNKKIETLAADLITAQEESKSNYDQLETLQALLEAHDEGSSTLLEESQKLTETLSATKELHLQEKKKSTELSSQFKLKEKEMQKENLALKAEIEKLKNTVNSSQEEVSSLLTQALLHEKNTKKTQALLDEQAKDLEHYQLKIEQNDSQLTEELKQKTSALEELTETLKTTKEQVKSKGKDVDSLQLSLDEQKAINEALSAKKDALKKALSLSDKLNVDYERKTTEFVSQLAFKDEKIKDVELVLKNTQQELKTIEPQVSQIKSLIHEYEQSSKDMLEKLSSLESQSDTYQADLLEAESKLKETQELLAHKEKESSEELYSLKLKLQERDDEAQLIKNNLSKNESIITQSNKEKTECDKEIVRLKERLDSKKIEIDNLTTNLASTQQKLKLSESKREDVAFKLASDASVNQKSTSSSSKATTKKQTLKTTKIVENTTDENKGVIVDKGSLESSVKSQGLLSSTMIAKETTELSKPSSNEYEIETIEGIGKSFGDKLRRMNISTTTDLLNKATSSADIHDIANKLKQKSWIVRSWVSMSDLLRVEGIDAQYAGLLEFSGIHSVQSLAKQTANPLSKKMLALNKKEQRVKVVPKSATVAEWIIYATTLSPRLTDNLESIQKKAKPKDPAENSTSPQSEFENKLSNVQKNDYDIEEIDGIGKGHGKRLRAMGIHTTTKLLNKCTNTDYEKNIAQAMTLNEKVVTSWCQMADLIRVKGIDGQLASLLFCSGITSVKELSIQDVNKLTSKIESVNKAQRRIKETPTQEMIAMWVASAQSLCK